VIYIVTPVFNRIKFTEDYLTALAGQTDNNFKIIIVDDGSTDGTADIIKKKFPDVILLEQIGDLWWAEATNIGVKHAIKLGASHVLTLNDDTLPKPDFIEKMSYWSKKSPTVLLGALAINVANEEIIFAGEILNWNSDLSKFALDTVPDEKRYGLHEINIFPGRGLLIPVSVFNDIGFYDSKNFPQTIADLDFAIRATEFGYKMYCNYDAAIKIYTDESATVKLVNNKSWRNYYNHLFSIRGGGNLKWFTIFTFKNAPKKYVLQYWLKGMSRRIGGYLIGWIKELKS
jgi:GT2 family glycosyltransferase